MTEIPWKIRHLYTEYKCYWYPSKMSIWCSTTWITYRLILLFHTFLLLFSCHDPVKSMGLIKQRNLLLDWFWHFIISPLKETSERVFSSTFIRSKTKEFDCKLLFIYFLKFSIHYPISKVVKHVYFNSGYTCNIHESVVYNNYCWMQLFKLINDVLMLEYICT